MPSSHDDNEISQTHVRVGDTSGTRRVDGAPELVKASKTPRANHDPYTVTELSAESRSSLTMYMLSSESKATRRGPFCPVLLPWSVDVGAVSPSAQPAAYTVTEPVVASPALVTHAPAILERGCLVRGWSARVRESAENNGNQRQATSIVCAGQPAYSTKNGRSQQPAIFSDTEGSKVQIL